MRAPVTGAQPPAHPARGGRADVTPAVRHPRPAPPTVLLVDPVDDDRVVVSLMLAHVGYWVLDAPDVARGCEEARTLRPDVVLLGVTPPARSAWEVVRRLKTDPTTRHAPVVVLTSFASRDDREHALEAGCDVLLVKPVSPRDVAEEVGRLLGRPPWAPVPGHEAPGARIQAGGHRASGG